jgi:mono/diheme cytochrome c family protein
MPPIPSRAAENLRGDRNKNMELAKTDRQAVFKGDCRSCHVDKGSGKLGKELYAADCGICHDSPIRAALVPDLRAPKAPRDHNYWVNWITSGRPGSMMPAFGVKDGGPLSEEQIASLAKYLGENFPQGPAPQPARVIAPAHLKPGGSQ